MHLRLRSKGIYRDLRDKATYKEEQSLCRLYGIVGKKKGLGKIYGLVKKYQGLARREGVTSNPYKLAHLSLVTRGIIEQSRSLSSVKPVDFLERRLVYICRKKWNLSFRSVRQHLRSGKIYYGNSRIRSPEAIIPPSRDSWLSLKP